MVKLTGSMRYGAHLPLIRFDGAGQTLARSPRVRAARRRACSTATCAPTTTCSSRRPWLDGPTALAATLDAAADMTLATTVCLPVIRGPVQSAKTLAALDLLSGGRLVAGVGPGSSARDYAAIGVPFEERWQRFDEAIRALRALLGDHAAAFSGSFYSTEGSCSSRRRAVRQGRRSGSRAGARPPACAVSLGSATAGSRPATTRPRPVSRRAWRACIRASRRPRRDPTGFPNAIATMWLYVSEARRDAERVLGDVLAPMLNRPVEPLRELALPIGSAAQCAERIRAYQDAGAERIFVWPLADELGQLERFRTEVVPLVDAA